MPNAMWFRVPGMPHDNIGNSVDVLGIPKASRNVSRQYRPSPPSVPKKHKTPKRQSIRKRFPSIPARPVVSAEKAQNRKTTKHPETLHVSTGHARRQCRKSTKPQNDKASRNASRQYRPSPSSVPKKHKTAKRTKHPEMLHVSTGQARRQCRKSTKAQNDKAPRNASRQYRPSPTSVPKKHQSAKRQSTQKRFPSVPAMPDVSAGKAPKGLPKTLARNLHVSGEPSSRHDR
jgi:hypothetical protein